MERIILKVDKRTAQKWRFITQEQQRQIGRIISEALELLEKDVPGGKLPVGYARPSEENRNLFLEEKNANWQEYKKLLNKSRTEARANGLTEMILDKLLEEDND